MTPEQHTEMCQRIGRLILFWTFTPGSVILCCAGLMGALSAIPAIYLVYRMVDWYNENGWWT